MDGVSLASGVAGLITLALQVSDAINQYATAIRDRSKNIKELLEELALLAEVLGKLKEFLDGEHGKGRSFDEGSVLDRAVADCKGRIERIQSKLKPASSSKLARAWDKMTWPFEQKDVLQMIENLRRFTHTFQFAVSIEGCAILSKSSDEVSQSMKEMLIKVDQVSEMTKHIPGLEAAAQKSLETGTQLQSIITLVPTLLQQAGDIYELNQANKLREAREYAMLRTDILDWLAPENSLQRHPDVQSQRAPDAGQWFLQHPAFVDWVSDDYAPTDLLCIGGPGRGKTILCSLAIDHLRRKFQDTADTAIIHYYCDVTEQQAQTPMHFTTCLLRQLCALSEKIPATVIEFYGKTRNAMRDTFWYQQLQAVLQRVIASFTRCFLVIDALDETEAKVQRRGVFEVLECMRTSSGLVKIFATTRPHQGVELHFPNAICIEVNADQADIRQFLLRKINEHPHSRDIIDVELETEIITQLCSHADGMFLLPVLQIDDILDQVTKGDVRRALASLSTTVEGLFGKTLDRIRRLKKQERELACSTLMWLSHAKCHLTILELQHALGIHFENTDLDLDDVPLLHRILDSCCGLVKHDDDSPYLRFVHGTLYEHLRADDHGLFENAELELTKRCLKYMLYDSARLHPSKSRTDLVAALEKLPLLEYACSFWGYHARGQAVDHYGDLALAFLNDSTHLLVAARVKDFRNQEYLRKWKERMWAWALSGGNISLAASFGLTKLMQHLLSETKSPVLTARNMFGSTPLHECAMYGYYDTASVLITHGAPVLEQNNGKATPFYLAISYEQKDVARLLLEHNRDQLNTHCKDGFTALHKAADSGSDEMVSFLLEWGASVSSRDDNMMTPLHLACRRGYLSIVRLLVEAQSEVDNSSRDGFNPIDYAATGGFGEIVRYLLACNARITTRNRLKWTALHRAARAGHAEVVRILLDHGISVLAEDRAGRIPLGLAAQSGDQATIEVILNHNPDLKLTQLQHKEKKGSTAKVIAFYTAHFKLHKFLRDVENDLLGNEPILNPGPDPTIPVTHAIDTGSLAMLQMLVEAQPELLTMVDPSGQTPLHTAFVENRWEIASYILEKGVSINIRGYHGWCPIHIAASIGSIRMICLALQWNADVQAVTETRQGPLHKACSSNNVEVIRELMRCGCDPSTPNNRGMTAIHVAAHRNFLEGVREMLRPEWTKNHPQLALALDNSNRSARSWAEFSGHLEVAAFLKIEERKARGKRGTRTPSAFFSTIGGGVGSRSNSRPLSRQDTTSSTITTLTNSSIPLSRQSTNISTSSLLSPPPSIGGGGGGHRLRHSVDSLFSDDWDDEDTYSMSSKTPSPMRGSSPRSPTPTTAHTVGDEPSMADMQARYAELELFESD